MPLLGAVSTPARQPPLQGSPSWAPSWALSLTSARFFPWLPAPPTHPGPQTAVAVAEATVRSPATLNQPGTANLMQTRLTSGHCTDSPGQASQWALLHPDSRLFQCLGQGPVGPRLGWGGQCWVSIARSQGRRGTSPTPCAEGPGHAQEGTCCSPQPVSVLLCLLLPPATDAPTRKPLGKKMASVSQLLQWPPRPSSNISPRGCEQACCCGVS